jgi:hypothetical protein
MRVLESLGLLSEGTHRVEFECRGTRSKHCEIGDSGRARSGEGNAG